MTIASSSYPVGHTVYPTVAPPICPQRRSSFDVSTLSFRPRHGRSCNSVLAAPTRTRVDFKVAVMVFCVLHDRASPCLNQLVVSLTCLAVADFARRQHTYCVFHHSIYRSTIPSIDCRPSFVSRRSQHPSYGIPSHWIFSFPLLCQSSVNVFQKSFPELLLWQFVSLLFYTFMDFEIVLLF